MKIKIAEAIGPALDWLVAKANSIPLCLSPFTGSKEFVLVGQNGKPTTHRYEPTLSWAQGGPIIEREKIGVVLSDNDANIWVGSVYEPEWRYNRTGPTPLIAAMRCYVASKLGDKVEVPEELE